MYARMFPIAALAAAIPLAVRSAAAGTEPDFARDVQPILTAHCIGCHGPDKRENALRLDSGDDLLHGGDNGPAIVPGKSAESLLMQAVLGTSDAVSRMPLK